MPYLLGDDGPGIEEGLVAFGLALREARYRAKLTQMQLERRSGVDQTLISRLERAKAPHCSLHRILSIQLALGGNLPLGSCPHDHDCQFRTPALPPHLARRFDFREFIRVHRARLAQEAAAEEVATEDRASASVPMP